MKKLEKIGLTLGAVSGMIALIIELHASWPRPKKAGGKKQRK